MPKTIDGVTLHRNGDYAICYVSNISSDLKELIKKNLATICHGSHVTEYPDEPLFGYQATLNSFLERYDAKPDLTKKGMIGEFLSHILITELFDEFDIASAYFNLEEKSIKKGFDLLLYNSESSSVWITEVKSGNLHKNKNHDQTTLDLINTAKDDLDGRLNKPEQMYWLNAVNSVRSSLNDEKDYKKILVKILVNKGGEATKGLSKSSDVCVVLVSNLFEPLSTKITDSPAKAFLAKIGKKNPFAKVLVFCIQKETFSKIVDFLRIEVTIA